MSLSTITDFDDQFMNSQPVFQVFNSYYYSYPLNKRAIVQRVSLSKTTLGGRVFDPVLLAKSSLRSVAVARKYLPNASSTQGLQVALQVAFRDRLLIRNSSDLPCSTSDGGTLFLYAQCTIQIVAIDIRACMYQQHSFLFFCWKSCAKFTLLHSGILTWPLVRH